MRTKIETRTPSAFMKDPAVKAAIRANHRIAMAIRNSGKNAVEHGRG